MADRVPETIGELGVILVRVEEQLKVMVTQQTFAAEQERTREEFRDVRNDHTEWVAESRGAHGALDTKIEAVKNELTIKLDAIAKVQADAEADRQRTKSARLFQVAGWVLVGFLGFGLGLLQHVLTRG